MSRAANVEKDRADAQQRVATYESAGDRERREWAENSGDFAFPVVLFLTGLRAAPINSAEIVTTQMYARCNQPEKDALRYVCGQNEDAAVTADDHARLLEKDNWLMKFLDGKTIGHRDWVVEAAIGIRAYIARVQRTDAALFPKQFPTRSLFRWIWDMPASVATGGDHVEEIL